MDVGLGIRVSVGAGVRVTGTVGEAGTDVGDDVIVCDAPKATDVAVGDVGIGPVQLAMPSTMNSNVRLDRMKCSRKRIFFMISVSQSELAEHDLLSFVHYTGCLERDAGATLALYV